MREDYIRIVRMRLLNADIADEKKLSIHAIAKELSRLGHRAPRNKLADVPYRVARNLAQMVGEVRLTSEWIEKRPEDVVIDDFVRISALTKNYHGKRGKVVEVIEAGSCFNVRLYNYGPTSTIKVVDVSEIHHIPAPLIDERFQSPKP